MKRINDICGSIIKILFLVVAISGIANKLFWYSEAIYYITDVTAVMSMIGIFVTAVVRDTKKDQIFKEEEWVSVK